MKVIGMHYYGPSAGEVIISLKSKGHSRSFSSNEVGIKKTGPWLMFRGTSNFGRRILPFKSY